MRILVVLQNAWANTARGAAMMAADRDLWLWATERCRSGGRLKRLLGEGCFEDGDIVFSNTTPEVGVGPSSRLPPDDKHILSLLEDNRPDVVVALGQQAESALARLYFGPLLALPHPACRVLTNALLDEARALLFGDDGVGRLALRQGRGVVVREQVA